jgi:hypothetical protein
MCSANKGEKYSSICLVSYWIFLILLLVIGLFGLVLKYSVKSVGNTTGWIMIAYVIANFILFETCKSSFNKERYQREQAAKDAAKAARVVELAPEVA